MKFYIKYIKKYWKRFLAGVAFLGLETAGDLMMPAIMARIVDIGVKGKDLNYIAYMGMLMLGITLLGAAAAVSRNVISSRVSQEFGTELRSDLFRKIQSFSFENIDKFDSASLMTRLTNDVTQVQNFAHGMMRIFVKAPLICIGSLIMATFLNPRMALVLVVVVPVITVLIVINMKVGYPFFTKVQKRLDKVNGVMREYLAGVRVVKAFNCFDYEVSRFGKANEELADLSINAGRIMAVFSPGITLTVNIGIAVVLLIGGQRVNSGELEVGKIIAFINYMTQVLFSLMMISWVFNMFVRARASSERLGEVMVQENTMKISEKSEEYEYFKNHEVPMKKGRVDFDKVYFAYAGSSGEPVLKNISFTCMPGETVGIIGSTGAGKSSLVNLIPRFYDTSAGTVKVNGIDVREVEPNYLREKISMVPQKSILFTGTILENIRWGREDAEEADVELAAKISEAHGFISQFPEGYHTLLGQGGVNLSGGQKQRISIARALARNPEILILDDSTSAVDVTTEVKIREGLKEYAADLTCIIIAQRVTSVMGADKIVVLDNGELVGLGTHEELMSSCEVYRDIFRSQIGKEAV
jgi:ATP-binding cassette, subfamily B, multidrug efflux pump